VILGRKLLTPYQVNTRGQWLQDWDFDAYGDTFDFGPGYTGTDGRWTILNGRATAKWQIYVYSGPCTGLSNRFFFIHNEETKCECIQIGGLLLPSGSANPSQINTEDPPSAVTVYGEGFNTDGGMPLVEYYAEDGALVQEVQVTDCAADGSWVSGPTPNLWLFATGNYSMLVRNSSGDVVGSGVVTIVSYQPPCTSDSESVNQCNQQDGYHWDYDSCTCKELISYP
jgi:hypothetical protein